MIRVILILLVVVVFLLVSALPLLIGKICLEEQRKPPERICVKGSEADFSYDFPVDRFYVNGKRI